MVPQKQLLIVLSGLLHDTGKLFERGEVFDDAANTSYCLDACPIQPEGYASHRHSAYTLAFCDWLTERFGCLRELANSDWRWWCAAHHKNDEAGQEASFIREADRLSAQEREEGAFYVRDVHKQTLLEPVLERVFINKNTNNTATNHRYPVAAMNPQRANLFPLPHQELNLQAQENPTAGMKDPRHWRHMLAQNKSEIIAGYKTLCHEFMEDLEAMAAAHPDLPLPDLIGVLMTMLERYTANVPSATNVRHPDISLFDHLRTTAAIAEVLYLQKAARQQPKTATPFLLVCGDFSGVQRFIYNLSNKGAAKGLRGRSFYVQLFCRIAADFMLQSLGLTRASVLYNSGGKFYLLMPSVMAEKLKSVRNEINGWLLEEFGQTVFLGIGTAQVTRAMFEKGKMHDAWRKAAENLETDRLTPFADQLGADFFEPEIKGNPTKHCRVCGDSLQPEDDVCLVCKRLEKIGRDLMHAEALLVLRSADEQKEKIDEILGEKTAGTINFKHLDIQCRLIQRDMLKKLPFLRKLSAEYILFNELGEQPFKDIPLPGCAVSVWNIGRWNAQKGSGPDGEPWTFDDYAESALGISRLGVLRMDVDNLGEVFIRGLNFPIRNPVTVNGEERSGWGEVVADHETGEYKRRYMSSISRMATLSRQLDGFFSGYVPQLLKKTDYNKCQIIYGGGDDLFIIGAWDQLPGLAKTIRSEFGAFCCKNPDFTISGGLSLQRGKYPIYKGALVAGQAESRAKKIRSQYGLADSELDKDGFCFLNVAITWEDFEHAETLRDMLMAGVQNAQKNKGLLAFFSRMIRANKFRVEHLMRAKQIGEAAAWKHIAYEAWRWRTAYMLRRRFGDDQQRQEWGKILFTNQFFKNGQSALPVYNWLEMPVRWADYLTR